MELKFAPIKKEKLYVFKIKKDDEFEFHIEKNAHGIKKQKL